ncbi:MAG: glycosyltransferase family 2 protein [Acidimicrobiales bacterium]
MTVADTARSHEGTTAPASTVAVVIPCRNEAATVGDVVAGFRRCVPHASIVVADNGSTDDTAAIATAAGARVIGEPHPGKGNAIRRLFADIDADCFVMVDGDATYDPETAPAMIAEVLEHGTDMVVGRRVGVDGAFRPGHQLGNRVFSWTFRRLFRIALDDTLSGYRALSRRFVKTFPILSKGFEVETDLNAHAASLGLSYREIDTSYRNRPEGSHSKLGTWSDGLRIMRRLLRLFRDWRPLLSFSVIGLSLMAVATVVAAPVVISFARTGLVERQPTLIVAVTSYIIGFGLIGVGMILERIARVRLEVTRLLYLSMPSLKGSGGPAAPTSERP